MDDRIPLGAVLALGVTQIVGYGTLYYSFSILAPDMARDLGWSPDQVFAIFSGALLVGGVLAPVIGRGLDRLGAAMLMAAGSALAALTLLLVALSTSSVAFTAGIILLEVASGMVQYQAAFAALVEIRPRAGGRSITYLTLIAGFASTLFWPITTTLHAHMGWREIYMIFAALNLVICLPLHLLLLRQRRRGAIDGIRPDPPPPVIGALGPRQRRWGFVLVSMAFALQGFTLSAVLVHMVPLLKDVGLGMTTAVFVSTLFGPSQVFSRLINMIFGRRLAPPALATLSAVFIAGAVAVLQVSGSWMPGAVLFALLLGLGSGINSIAQGALPLYLFGSEGYGALTGKMAAIRLMAGATAPFALAFGMETIGLHSTLLLTALLGGCGIAGFATITVLEMRRSRRSALEGDS